MASPYSLQPNEVVLLKDESVAHGGLGLYAHELILTNLNLVLVKKGAFGRSKGVLSFPVDQIKVYDRVAQARIGKTSNGLSVLEVYLLNGEERFGFQFGGKKKINTWIAKINEIVTGQEASAHQAPGMALPGAGLVAGVLSDTIGVFKSKLGSTLNASAAVASKCRACGAPINGHQGQTVTCTYCDSVQQL